MWMTNRQTYFQRLRKTKQKKITTFMTKVLSSMSTKAVMDELSTVFFFFHSNVICKI